MDEHTQVVRVRVRRSRAEAQQLAAESEASGLNRGEFCRQQGLSLATLARMLKGGPDIRCIQAAPGRADLKTTQLYTQVSIRQLKQVHPAAHPAHPPKDRSAPAAAPSSAN